MFRWEGKEAMYGVDLFYRSLFVDQENVDTAFVIILITPMFLLWR